MTDIIFGREYVVKVTDDGECVTAGELIRCKDCYWYQESDTFKGMNCWHYGGMERPELNDFCSWAERKEE